MPIIDNMISSDFIKSNIDLCPYYSGIQDCDPGHFYGPAVRDHFLIHYILSGKGTFEIGDRVYHLGKGQGFLICPGIVTYYKADMKDPWEYTWVAFHGLNAESYLKRACLSNENPIFTYPDSPALEEVMRRIVETMNLKKCKELMFTSLLYHFISLLIEAFESELPKLDNESRKDFYVRKTIEFIQMNYSRNISIEELANHIGLDRKYLSSVFKNVLKISPQLYLLQFRMNKACELLRSTSLSIGDIARSVGYEDPLLFSRMFRKIKDQSPSQFRASAAG
ncbi:MAG: AraC family transcriptional regulator [Clostridia bacterium]|nr:AraC family transcriptional regulator [Clostridia bacterium]